MNKRHIANFQFTEEDYPVIIAGLLQKAGSRNKEVKAVSAEKFARMHEVRWERSLGYAFGFGLSKSFIHNLVVLLSGEEAAKKCELKLKTPTPSKDEEKYIVEGEKLMNLLFEEMGLEFVLEHLNEYYNTKLTNESLPC